MRRPDPFCRQKKTKMPRKSMAKLRGRNDISAAVAVRILQHVADEKLAVGTHIPAQELADRFAVSRSPVNQALKLLCGKGLVTHHPNKGYFIATATPVSAEQAGLAVDDALS